MVASEILWTDTHRSSVPGTAVAIVLTGRSTYSYEKLKNVHDTCSILR